jgi:hypothetical protein
LEEYDVAPLDDDEERRERELDEQSYAMEKERLHDSSLPDDDAAPGAGSFSSGPAEDIQALVIAYLSAMMESRLDEAEALVSRIREQKKAAKAVIGQLSTDSIPPAELSAMPAPLMHGFLKSLSSQL